MNRVTLTAAAVAGVLIIVLGLSALFTVDQPEQAIVLQFGEFKRQVRDPGLHVKLPFIQNVVYFDRRVLDTDPPTEEVIAADQKRLVVDSYARFRIVDPLLFYQSMGTQLAARGRLNATISGSLRRGVRTHPPRSGRSRGRRESLRPLTRGGAPHPQPLGLDRRGTRAHRAH